MLATELPKGARGGETYAYSLEEFKRCLPGRPSPPGPLSGSRPSVDCAIRNCAVCAGQISLAMSYEFRAPFGVDTSAS